MFEIDSSGSIDGRFSEGNASTGQVATRVSADWLNMVQDELRAFLAAAGIDPEQATSDQVLAAAQQLFVGTTGAQTIAGVKGFSSFPLLPATDPTEDTQAAHKGYVDSAIAAAQDVVQPSCIIEGLQISRAGVNTIQIEAGVIQVAGELYSLPAAVTITSLTATAFGWRGVRMAVPISGNELDQYSFATCSLANIVRGTDNIWWWDQVAIGEGPIIGIYPYADDDVIEGFKITGGLYNFHREVIYDTTPPTIGYSDPDPHVSYNVGLPPIGEDVIGYYVGLAEANSASSVVLVADTESEISVYAAGTLGKRRCWGPIHIISPDGTSELHVTTEGTSVLMRLRIYACTIPSGMAR